MAEATLAPAPARPGPDLGPLAIVGVMLALGLVLIGIATDARQASLFGLGGLLGVTLYHASFGFTAGWRNMILEKRGMGLRMQLLTIALAALAMIPLTSLGSGMIAATAPVGVSVLVGAFLFGAGMQLGGGCGSGTLFTVGGGNARMLLTLVFFIVGAVIGTAHLPAWLDLPSLPAITLGSALGPWAGIAVTLIGLALVTMLTLLVERRAHGAVAPMPALPKTAGDWLWRGPWPLLLGAVLLALLNIATLLIAGHPWSITFAFGLWGAKIVQAVGVPVETWTFWTWPGPAKALGDSVLADTVSVMDFGLILGAALAATLAGKFAPKAKIPLKSALAAIIGGLMMGYGARLGFGCNIGAFFSGIATGSLHGWLWFASAFAGSILGVYLRPLFGFDGLRLRK